MSPKSREKVRRLGGDGKVARVPLEKEKKFSSKTKNPPQSPPKLS